VKSLTFHYDGMRMRHVHILNWLRTQVTCVDVMYENARADGVFERGPCPRGAFWAVADDGSVYCGDKAWLMCLWATYDYRLWSIKLAERGANRRALEVLYALSGAA